MLLRKAAIHIPLVTSLLLSRAATYTWPAPQYDALEELLYEGIDKTDFPVAILASGCISRLFDGGPPINAEWLRLAYHDMATHNITDGTGGLDASIYYELSRAENIGAGMLDTLSDFQSSSNKFVSRADIIAMGAIWGVAGCSGPPIPFRGGRIDANGPGRLGVPEPQQDLQSHKDSFKLQGFNETEMIALVACGHTFGGVRAVDFPTIVIDKRGVNPTVGSFDSTIKYDNTIVTEYLSGTTKNPLVLNTNTTVLSDLRIFSSDGNATIKSIKSPTTFANTCKDLIARMIDTVPSDVQLTEEITLLPFKVKKAELIISGSGIVFNVISRVALPAGATRFTPILDPIPTVQLFWCDRAGPSADCADGTANVASSVGRHFLGSTSPLADALNTSFQTYEFRAPVAADASVGKFWFGLRNAEKRVDETVLMDNGGEGYLVEQDMVVLVPELSVSMGDGVFTQAFGMVVGVKSTSVPTLAEMRIFDKNIRVRPGPKVDSIPEPLNFTSSLRPLSSVAPVAGYTFYIGNFTDAVGPPSVDFTVDVDGRRYQFDFVQPPMLNGVAAGDDILELSKVGKMTLTDAMFGGKVNTTVGSNGNGTDIPLAAGSEGGTGTAGGDFSGASELESRRGLGVLVGVLAVVVGVWLV